MESLRFFMPGIPTAKARSRFVRRGFKGPDGKMRYSYPDGKTVAGERGIAQFAAEAMRGRPLFDMPVELRVIAVLLPPKTRTRAQRAMAWADFRGSRPDIDNYIKAVMDACICVVFTDDALVASVHAAKIYGLQPGIHVSVHPLYLNSWPLSECVSTSRPTTREVAA